MLLAVFLAAYQTTEAQEFQIRGKVTDYSTGEGLPGTTILVKGSNNGVTSDIEGNYAISVGNEAILVFSFIGYETEEVVVGNKSIIDISLMPDIESLSEVVVVGYGTQQAKDVTGAIGSVSSKDFNRGAIPSPDNLIAGKVAGVLVTPSSEPGGGSNIQVRGVTSLNNTYPLIVVDGIPLDNSGYSGGRNGLNFINPNDIESVTVLKDASASAIYGSRAAAGVIIYTTKSGKAGKSVFSYDGFYSISRFKDDFGFLSPGNFRAAIELKAPQKLGDLGSENTVWADQVLQQVSGQSHNLSFSGGSEKTSFSMSVNHMINRGVVKNSENNITRVNLRVASKFLNDNLKVSFQSKNAFTSDNFSSNVTGTALSYDPTKPVYDPENLTGGGYYEWTGSLSPSNPVSTIDQNLNLGETRRSLSAVEVDYKIPFIKGLSYNAIASFDLRNGKNHTFSPTTYRPNDATNGFISNTSSQGYTYSFEEYVKYDKNIDRINTKLDVMAGYSFQEVYREQFGYFGDNLTTDDYLYNNPSVIVNLQPVSLSPVKNRLKAYFGRINTTVADKYMFTANFRYDGSTRFGENNRFGFFPSVAVGWRLIDEDFMSFLEPTFTDLKLRIGYGVTGNQSFGDYLYETFYSLGTNDATYQFGTDYVQLLRPVAVDPDVRWEETTSTNIGFDFGLLNNRLTGSLELYNKRTSGILVRVPVSAGTNVGDQVTTNVAELVNNGVELSLSSIIVDNDDFDWSLNLNSFMNKNEVKKLTRKSDANSPGIDIGGISGDVGQTIQIIREGYPYGGFKTYEQKYNGSVPVSGTQLERYVDQNDDGIINENDYVIRESYQPKVVIGLTSSMSYKDFSLDFTIRSNIGNYVYNNTASANGYFNKLTEGGILNNIHESALETNFATRQLKSDYYLENASFVRLDNITLSYNLNRLDFTKIRLYGTVQNLLTISGYSGPNPEVGNGIDNNLYPLATTFIVGINLTF